MWVTRSRSRVVLECSCQGTLMTMIPGSKQQPGLQTQRGLVVEKVFPPTADDILRNVDGDDVARSFAAPVLDVVDDGPGDLAVGRVDDGQLYRQIMFVPLLLQGAGIDAVDV
jgi:hypothetical protein